MRRKGLNASCLLSVLLAVAYLVYEHVDFHSLLQDADRGPAAPPPVAASADETIHIASFNIQVFGVTKMSRPEVVDILVDVVRRFDVIAIQELRAKDQMVIPQFVDIINADGSHYQYVVGPRLGRTHSKEQYVYLYDATRIELDTQWVYTVPDPEDLLHREPLVARFRARGPPPEEAFSFSLVNIHTDPNETATELDALADVFVAVQNDGSGEDDVILLGDLNVGPRRMGRLGQLPYIMWTVTDEPTNTRGTQIYDNIVFDTRYTTEYTGTSGVMNLMEVYDLTLEEALLVSDHFPVWAEFSIYEDQDQVPTLAEPPEVIRSTTRR